MQETENTKYNVPLDAEEPIIHWTPLRLWTVRIVLLILIGGWGLLWLHVHNQVKISRAKVEQKRIEASRRQEFLRRGAQYQQELQERTRAPRARNVFDGR